MTNGNTVTKSCFDCGKPSEGLRCEACFENQPATPGSRYTIADLRVAFDRVASRADWRGPIVAAVKLSQANITREAVEFFTGTTPIFRVVKDGLLVRASGYRAGQAGAR